MSTPGKNSGEFGIIEKYFAPLSKNIETTFGLKDDAALLDIPAGQQLVLTKDALVAGTHFFADDPADLVARKLLRTNLSDLAAMGAKPLGYLLATAWNAETNEKYIEAFAQGLRRDQEEFEITLLGGDTVKTTGPMSFSLTAIGTVKAGQALRRNGARVGDRLFVTGTLGDSALGLKVKKGHLGELSEDHKEYLVDRYLLPGPRIEAGQLLSGYASACLDISDGLLADLGHLITESGVSAVINPSSLPLSDAAKAALKDENADFSSILSGGDDYELLFSVPQHKVEAMLEKLRFTNLQLTEIGRNESNSGIFLAGEDGELTEVPAQGWTHF
ncbi:MAG: thiamine-phosphate kinase [Sneathiellales bacterium]|nr:thiamine-phosphate kinase [Sneathiellales bacterium]